MEYFLFIDSNYQAGDYVETPDGCGKVKLVVEEELEEFDFYIGAVVEVDGISKFYPYIELVGNEE